MYSSALKSFAFNTTDIEFLLAQVNFRPLFDADGNAILNWDGTGAIYDSHHTLLWDGVSSFTGRSTNGTLFSWSNIDTDGAGVDTAATMTAAEKAAAANVAVQLFGTSYQNGTDLSGLRDPSGLNNNLALVNSGYGAVDHLFPRMAPADYTNYLDILSGGATGAFAANETYFSRYGGAGFEVIQRNPGTSLNESTDYTITAHVGPADPTTATALDGTVLNINNIIDYTPRMISLLTTTAGVVYDTWASHSGDPDAANHTASEIYYDANGVATVTDWGDLRTVAAGGLGQVDTQARFAGSAGEGEQFIGGLNPGVSPSNGFFVLFGQFFDHGLDFIDKGAQGATIRITFSESDPLYGMNGPDGQPVYEITMARASVQSIDANGPQYTDHTSPFIDQSQTYGSHEQLTTLLREWVTDPASGNFHAGMNMFDGQTLETAWKNANGDMVHDTLPTLNELRAHVEATGRDALSWEDVLNLRNRDEGGHLSGGNSDSALILDMNPRFDAAHLYGFYDKNMNGVQDGSETASANAAQNAAVTSAIGALDTYVKATFGLASTFGIDPSSHKLTLYMENLPVGSPPGTPHTLEGANAMFAFVNFANMSIKLPAGAEHDAIGTLLLASVGDHYIAGDGRVNENFGLTSIHHVFHEEHNFQVGNFIDALHREAISTNSFDNLHSFQIDMTASGGSIDAVTHDYLNASGEVAWNLDKMFNAAKLVVEMEYQHAAVDQYARNVTPNIQEFVGYSPDRDPSVTLDFAQAAFRFGHSTLRETIDTIDPTHGLTGKIMGYALRDAFLNPDGYMDLGPAAILLGMSHQQMNEVDEFITPALNQGLLGQPLDLAAINIARGRDLGIPTLNDFREAIGLARYSSWTEFGNNMQHPTSLVNFIAAYSFDGNLAAAQEVFDLIDGIITIGANGMTTEQAFAFMEGGDQGFNQIDTWLGGLAEIHQPGGLLGETFDLVFVSQIEALMDGDRFYYLFRLAGQQFAEEVGGGQLKDIVERNTGLIHLNGNIFGYADKYYDFSARREIHQLDDINSETNTTSNNHKYGDVYDSDGNFVSSGALTAHPTLGVYTNTGRSSALDGTIVTINGVQYIRDTRLADTGQDTGAALLNDGVNLDGTPNSGAESNEILVGTDNNDLLYANGGDDTVYGEGGDDIIYGGFGIDRLYGGDGSDRLYGGDNPDLMDGGSGDDFLYGESSGSDINGADQLIGGSGNDFVSGGVGIDKLSGGTGDDHVVGDGDTDPFTHGSDGNDWVEGNSGGDILYGDNGDDVLVGGSDQDQMFGGNGDDIIRPGDVTGALTIGTDETLGGDGVTDIDGNGVQGFDIIDFSDNAVRAGGVTFSLADQINPGVTINGTPTQTQAFQMEGVVGSAGNDTLTGGSTNAEGDTDNDWIVGGAGNDLLTSGDGNDIIVGGSIRLDELIGRYNSGYTHNNNNTGLTAAQQLEDARYQGASHRVLYSETIDNTGLIDAANALGGTQFEKHLTEMLRSDQFRNTELGDRAGLTVAGNDTVVFSGSSNNYTIEQITYGSHKVIKLTDITTHISKLVIDVANFQFGTGPAAKTFTFDQMVSKPTVSVSDVAVTEGNVGTTPANFVISLSQVYAHDVTVTYSTGAVGDTAAAGSDYVALTGSIVIVAGSISATVPVQVQVNGDMLSEGDETFTLNITGATASANDPGNPGNIAPVIVADGKGLGTILNDDQVNISVGNAVVGEGSNGVQQLNFTVSLAQPVAATVTVHYATVVGTATAGTDYAAIADNVLTFLPGETSHTVSVAVTGDIIQEGDETVRLVLSNNSANSSILIDTGMGVILNDDLIGTAGANGTALNPFAVPNNGVSSGVTLNYYVDGLGGNDFLQGGAGNDTIVGGTGNDNMAGGTGNDTYVVDATGDVVAENALEGTDTVNSSVNFKLAANVENLTQTGVGNINGTGNAGVNVIIGNTGNNMLNGAGGADTLIGGTGNDTYIIDNIGVTITEANAAGTDTVRTSLNAFTLGADLENLVFTGTGDFVGTGNSLNNSITGGTGNDTLNGGGGTDVLIGGAGNDTYIVDAIGATITETGTGGTDTVNTSLASYTLANNVENLNFTGTGAFTGTGNGGDNIIVGGAGADTLSGGGGADTLNGGLGADTMSGGNGNDTYIVDNIADAVSEVGGGGTDTVQTTLGSFTLGTGVENLTYAGAGNFSGTGNASANTLTGGNGDDTLNGGTGNDILNGGLGTDTFIQNAGDTGRDIVNGGAGTDTYILNGTSAAENFVIYTRAEAIIAGFGVGLAATTEIVVTRAVGAAAAAVVAELADIQEIRIQTNHNANLAGLAGSLANSASPGLTTNAGGVGGDNIRVVGDFTQTSLAYNTITIDGTTNNDTVDISGLSSPHRVVFNTEGGQDTVIGALRPQDVINGTLNAATNGGATNTQLTQSFLSQDWHDFAGIGSWHSRWEPGRFVSIDNLANAASDWTMGAIHTMPDHIGIELYQELAPLADFAGVSGLGRFGSVAAIDGPDHWVNGPTYHAPAKWLSDDDMFNHFVHDVNGHFIS
jgi:Ca2+-binding RTX toxin-like protein